VDMLNLLTELPRADALDLLGSAIIYNGTHPFDLDDAENAQVISLIRQIKDDLKISYLDRTPEASAIVSQALSDTLDSILFSSGDLDATKTRMADDGILPINGYEIQISVTSEISARIGYKALKETVINPDRIEVLVPPKTWYEDASQFNTVLYAKKMERSDVNRWIIATTLRNDFTIKVLGSFVVDLKLVGSNEYESIDSWVMNFALKYGIEFEFGEFGVAKYFHDIAIPFETARSRSDRLLSRDGIVYYEMSGHNDQATETYILFMFLVDKQLYFRDLRNRRSTKKVNRR